MCEEPGSGVAEGFSHFLQGQQIVMEIEIFFFSLYILNLSGAESFPG